MPYIASRKAAQRLGVCAHALHRWADAGHIPCIRPAGGQRRCDVDACLRGVAEPVPVAYARVSSPGRKMPLHAIMDSFDCDLQKG